ncbi:MAG: signal peptidase II [Spirochaetales bacterium]|nr:signal peptidase II [Spirochaetales bacterium]
MRNKENIHKHRIIFVAIITALNIILDQVSKVIARSTLIPFKRVPVVGDLFRLELVNNRGAFLGMGGNLPDPLRFIVFAIIPTILIALLAVYIYRNKKLAIYELACFGTIMGGGLSNLVDRYIYSGKVTDFLNFGIGPKFRTGILNIADMSITFGALVLLVLYLVFNKKESEEEEEKKKGQQD